jgi:prepilin-type N-terminal cleavage/methylation domain-containing protein
MVFRIRKKLKGFSLIEILAGIVILASIASFSGSAFFILYRNWMKQRDSVVNLENGRWVMEKMTNEIRFGTSAAVVSAEQFRFDDHLSTTVWFWRGDGGANGSVSVIYRGTGATLSAANANRQECINAVINNAAGAAIFSSHASFSNVYLFKVTVERNNKQYALASQVRVRN